MRLIWLAASLCVGLAGCVSAPVAGSPPPPPGPQNLDGVDVDVFAGSGDVIYPDQCGYTGSPQFPWPPPEPTDRVKLDPLWFGVQAGKNTPVSEIARAVARAFHSIGHVDVGYQSVGCDGFAAISYLERIDPQGRPLADDVRFLPPGAKEPWSLTGYLTRLFSAPEGKYRQIIIIGTDKAFTGYDDPPSASDVLELMDEASAKPPGTLATYAWRRQHTLVALIYEFDRPAGRGDPVRVDPRGLGGKTHLSGAGLYRPKP